MPYEFLLQSFLINYYPLAPQQGYKNSIFLNCLRFIILSQCAYFRGHFVNFNIFYFNTIHSLNKNNPMQNQAQPKSIRRPIFTGIDSAFQQLLQNCRTHRLERSDKKKLLQSILSGRQNDPNPIPSGPIIEQQPESIKKTFPQVFQKDLQNSNVSERVENAAQSHEKILQSVEIKSQKAVFTESASKNIFGLQPSNQAQPSPTFFQLQQTSQNTSMMTTQDTTQAQSQASSIFSFGTRPKVSQQKRQQPASEAPVQLFREGLFESSSSNKPKPSLVFNNNMTPQASTPTFLIPQTTPTEPKPSQIKVLFNNNGGIIQNVKPTIDIFGGGKPLQEETRKEEDQQPQKMEIQSSIKSNSQQFSLFGNNTNTIKNESESKADKSPESNQQQKGSIFAGSNNNNIFATKASDETPKPSIFTNPPQTSQTSSSIFGTQTSTTVQPPPVVNIFAQSQKTSITPFPSQTHEAPKLFFGSLQQKDQPTASLTSSTPQQTPSLFGSSSNNTNKQTPQAPESQSLFSSNISINKPVTSTLFSTPQTVTPTTNLFSTPATTTQAQSTPANTQPSLFGSSVVSTPQQPIQQANTGFFGSRLPTVRQEKSQTDTLSPQKIGLFGQPPQKNTQSQTNTIGLFGSTTNNGGKLGLFHEKKQEPIVSSTLNVSRTPGGLFGSSSNNNVQQVQQSSMVPTQNSNIFNTQTTESNQSDQKVSTNQPIKQQPIIKTGNRFMTSKQQPTSTPSSIQNPIPASNMFSRGQHVTQPQQQKPTNMFASSQPQPKSSTQDNPFGKVTQGNNIFSNASSNMFGGSGLGSQNMFANSQASNSNIVNVFGQKGGASLFAKKADQDDEDEGSEGDDDDAQQEQSEEQEQKGELKFKDYIETTVYSKLQAPKFKVVSMGKLLQKTIISLQQFPGDDKTIYIIVRNPNKTIAYFGKLAFMSRVNVKEKKEGDKEIFITIDKLIQIDEQNERKKSIDSWRLSFRDSPEAKEFVQKCQEIIKSEPKPDQSQ